MKAGSRGVGGPIRLVEVMKDGEESDEGELMCGVCGESDESEGREKLFCTDSEGEEERKECQQEKEEPPIQTKGEEYLKKPRSAEGREWRGEGEEVKRIRVEKEERVMKEMVDPRRPSNNEVEKHRRTHIPYRNWCEICVKSMGRDADHRRDVGKERGLSEYSFDYCLPGMSLDSKLTVMVGRERVTGMRFATAVPMKGSAGRLTVEKMVEFVDEVGDKSQQIVVKTDQEPSIEAVVEDLVKEREDGRTVVEESPKRSSGSNGVAERAAQEVEGRLRAILLEFESRIGEEVDAREPIMTFIPEYAAYLMNRLEVGKDGKTAYERVKGKAGTVVGLEFGEKVLWKKKKGDKQAKLRSRWGHGIFVGVRKRSGEIWVATKKGDIISVRTVKRIPDEERWSEDCWKWVKRTLWNKFKEDPEEDGDIPEGKEVDAESEKNENKEEETRGEGGGVTVQMN